MKARLFFIIFITIFSTMIVAGQKPDDAGTSQLSIPENIKEEVVRRILTFKFKPAKRPKIIYLGDQVINPAWLPKIANIEFKLLSAEQIEERETEVYFFTEAEINKKSYNIGFVFGDPACSYWGDSWNFRVLNGKIRLWSGGETGAGCAGRMFKTAGELNAYPHELKGYGFFNRGKLKGLQLTISTREDVKKNFGSDCDSGCDYDDKWEIKFSYFGQMYREKSVDNQISKCFCPVSQGVKVDNKRIRFVPKAEYLNRIYSIWLIPKQRTSFTRVIFPDNFSRSLGLSFSDGSSSSAGTSFDSYADRYGLEYTIFGKVDYTQGKVEKDERVKGDLVSIEYSIPEKIEEPMFTEQK